MSEGEFGWEYRAPKCPGCNWPFRRPPCQPDRDICRACQSHVDAAVKVESYHITEE